MCDVRARRLQWLGHILRMDTERLLKQTIFEMLKNRKDDDMVMHSLTHSPWRDLLSLVCAYTEDRDYAYMYWRTRVRSMRQPRLRLEAPEIMEGWCSPFTIAVLSKHMTDTGDYGSAKLQGARYTRLTRKLVSAHVYTAVDQRQHGVSARKELTFFEWPNTDTMLPCWSTAA